MGRVALRQAHDRFPAGVGLEPEQAPTIGIFCLVDEVHLRPDNVARLGHTFCWNIIVRVQDILMPPRATRGKVVKVGSEGGVYKEHIRFRRLSNQ